ncbi:MAG: hypothetical protein PHR87_13815 [Sulfurospirillaceae bacterium]|nr:hypothetical protein [Sulfurospirillaceae bacterium]
MKTYKTYICIDDTDELGGEISTGEISENLREYIQQNYAPCSLVTRHQLFLDDAIPYTSHNSSMCFTSQLNMVQKEAVIAYAIEHLQSVCAPSSQPGLCVGFEEELSDKMALIRFGEDAKRKVLTKEEAYVMAQMQNLHLSEHKNGGQGIIGALAGVGLRLQGNDGRVKGKIKVKSSSMSVKELLALEEISAVCLSNHEILPQDTMITIDSGLKTVWLNHQPVLLVEKTEEGYIPLDRESLRHY